MNNIEIQKDECIDLLTKYNNKIIQKKKGFRFSLDAVLLADFCNIKKNDQIIDLGTGSGIIPLILINKAEKLHIKGIEIVPEIAEMAKRSMMLNNFESEIEIIANDLKNIDKLFKEKLFDVVVCNPPYFAVGSGNINPDHSQAVARHEIACKLEDVIKTSGYLLKDTGSFFIVHKPERIMELFILLNKNKFQIYRVRFVHPKKDEKANAVLIECRKTNKKILEIMKPLIVFDNKGDYTEELQNIYY